MIVVAETPAADLVEALRTAGAFPIVETNWANAPAAFVAVQPSAMILAEPGPPANADAAQTLALQIKTRRGPFVPLIARVRRDAGPAIADAVPIDADISATRLVARLKLAMRVRTLHATVLRRLDTFRSGGGMIPSIPTSDPLEDATVVVSGRGRSYPALSVAVGERVGLIGALSIETAVRYLGARDVDGLILGDGFGPRVVEAMLTVLCENARFRDLPVAVHGGDANLIAEFAGELPNLERIEGAPETVVEWALPLIRLHAFEARLRRILQSLDSKGIVDPNSGLLTTEAFWSDLTRAITESKSRGHNLALARFSFSHSEDRRVCMDTARLIARVVRNVDFAWQDQDGSILCTFTDTDLGAAHLIARRIAGVLRQTMLTGAQTRRKVEANVTLASLKPSDTVESLTMRVGAITPVAAQSA
jgi:hypothetical protein